MRESKIGRRVRVVGREIPLMQRPPMKMREPSYIDRGHNGVITRELPCGEYEVKIKGIVAYWIVAHGKELVWNV